MACRQRRPVAWLIDGDASYSGDQAQQIGETEGSTITESASSMH